MLYDNTKVITEQVQHLALLCHVDGEMCGQWEPTSVPIDGEGRPVRRFGLPDARYPEGFKTFAFLGKYHDHTDPVTGELVSFALYKQTHTMLDAYRLPGYRRDTSDRYTRVDVRR